MKGVLAMRVTKIYEIRDSETDVVKKEEISTAIEAVENAFESFIDAAKESMLSGVATSSFDLSGAKEAMKLFKSYGVTDIPDEITDDAAKFFVVNFGKEMLF